MILAGYDKEITEWVCNQLEVESLGQTAAIGFIKNGKIIGGVVYHNYRWPNIELSIATISSKWCNKKNLKAIFDYPFTFNNAKRVTAIIDAGNNKAISLVEKLGFMREGLLRQGNPSGMRLFTGC